MTQPVEEQTYRFQRRFIFATTIAVIIVLIAAAVLL
jgi:hypothetical protein